RYLTVTGVQTCALPISLGEQDELHTGDVERHLAAFLERVAFDKTDDVGDLLTRPMGDHRHSGLALAAGRLALLRCAGQIAHSPRSEERRVGKECRSWGG